MRKTEMRKVHEVLRRAHTHRGPGKGDERRKVNGGIISGALVDDGPLRQGCNEAGYPARGGKQERGERERTKRRRDGGERQGETQTFKPLLVLEGTPQTRGCQASSPALVSKEASCSVDSTNGRILCNWCQRCGVNKSTERVPLRRAISRPPSTLRALPARSVRGHQVLAGAPSVTKTKQEEDACARLNLEPQTSACSESMKREKERLCAEIFSTAVRVWGLLGGERGVGRVMAYMFEPHNEIFSSF